MYTLRILKKNYRMWTVNLLIKIKLEKYYELKLELNTTKKKEIINEIFLIFLYFNLALAALVKFSINYFINIYFLLEKCTNMTKAH